MEYAKGDMVLVMDADLASTGLIPEMVSAWLEGYDLVERIKHSRGKENFIQSMYKFLLYNL